MLKDAGKIKRAEQYQSGSKDIKAPDLWSLKATDWRQKKREFIAYISLKRNKNGIPLVYLLRDNNEQPAIEQDHGLDGDTKSIIRNAPLTGEALNTGAQLQTLSTTPCCMDSKRVWAIFEAFWEGDRYNWTLAGDYYCSIHMSSQDELETLGIVRYGASQVWALLSGLRTDQIRQISAVIMNENGCNTDLATSIGFKLQNL